MLKEECGIVGVLNHPDAANLSYLALYALQHRGQEACGIISFETNEQEEALIHSHKSFGLVGDAFTPNTLRSLKGSLAIGHVRYSTQGKKSFTNIQPFSFHTPYFGSISIAHNGNLTNAKLLRHELEENGSIFTSSSDSEVFIHLIARSEKKALKERICDVVTKVKGAYSLVIQAKNRLYGIRDPHGFRPLVLGKIQTSYILVSESCALDLIGADYVRDIEAGEVLRIEGRNLQSFFPYEKRQKHSFCSFEPIYFSRPDSRHKDRTIYDYRKKMGELLATKDKVEADMVIAVPDSGVPAALGYSHVSKIPLELGLVRNHYVGRTFIEPTQEIRDFGVKLKLNPILSKIKDKKIIVIDDSIVRGTTSVKIIRMLRLAGAKQIHLRISSPPITHSCYYGVSTPNRKKLLAAQKYIHEIKQLLEVDSLAFLSEHSLQKALEDTQKTQYCYACFNGKYPEEIFATIEKTRTDS